MDWTKAAICAYSRANSMWYNPIFLRCECDKPLRGCIKEVGLTPEHQLVIRWSCPACKRKHHTVKALADCWRESSELKDALPLSEYPVHERETRLLPNLAVGAPENNENTELPPIAPRRCA